MHSAIKNISSSLYNYALVFYKTSLVFVVIRILEFILLYSTHSNDLSLTLLFERSVNLDILLLLLISMVFLPVYAGFSVIRKAIIGLAIFKALAFLLITLNVLFTSFFILSGFLMPAFVIEFSYNDIIHVIGTELTLGNWKILAMIFGVALLSYYLLISKEKKKSVSSRISQTAAFIYLVALIPTLLNAKHLSKDQKYFENSFQYQIGNSKITHFVQNIIHLNKIKEKLNSGNKKGLLASIEDYQALYKTRSFISKEYPLLQLNNIPNVLGPYFKESEKKPNLVLVVVESLSSTFSGTKTLKGSLTPFLDSLSKKGLYWENFYSNVDRTYGALPNILASLPYGKDLRGYINNVTITGEDIHYSPHLNLLQSLKGNGYQRNFFYGGWIGFDNTILFMRYNEIDTVVGEDEFNPENYVRRKHEELAWGFDDGQLVKRSFEDVDQIPTDQAFFNFYLTLSNHAPWALADSIFYEESFQNKTLKQNGISNGIENLSPMSNAEIASILFTDDALRRLFNGYKKRDDFNRTIFIIVGDHGGGSLATSNKLAPFQIPLVIYSDLISQPELFKGVCSHIDILPSLQSLLENNYNLSFPKMHPYIGQGLDTSTNFSANRIMPMLIWSNDRASFILDDLILEQESVYYLDEKNSFENCTDTNEINRIKNAHQDYLLLNKYVTEEWKIWPERGELR